MGSACFAMLQESNESGRYFQCDLPTERSFFIQSNLESEMGLRPAFVGILTDPLLGTRNALFYAKRLNKTIICSFRHLRVQLRIISALDPPFLERLCSWVN